MDAARMMMVDNQGTRIATQAFGQPTNPALILVMGATASMLSWPDELCYGLAERGLFVVRFDHRDTGRSSISPRGNPDYDVEDMAGDVNAIMDAYKLPKAHLMGMSLGGYIAQMVALQHPERILSLTLLGSEPLGWNGPPLPPMSQDFLAQFAAFETLDWSDRSAVTEFLLEGERLCAGSAEPFNEVYMRQRIGRILALNDSTASMFNHGSLKTSQDWTGRYREIACPVLVIHGDQDPILPIENGRAIAAGIAGAELLVLPGMGHELPLSRVPLIAERVVAHVERSGQVRAGRHTISI